MKPALTHDLGIAIRDFLEDQEFHLFDNSAGEMEETEDTRHVEFVDVSDPNNLIVMIDNGQTFTVRIIAGGGPTPIRESV